MKNKKYFKCSIIISYTSFLFIFLATNGIPLIQADNSVVTKTVNLAKSSFFDKITDFIALKTRSIFNNQQSETNEIIGVRPGGSCINDLACAGYPLAYCDTVCKCKENSYNAGSTCITLPTATQTNQGLCPSDQVYATEPEICVNRVFPGNNCQYSEQCSAIESGSFCRNNICECVFGMIKSNDGRRCIFRDNHCPTKGTIWVPELGECKQVIIPGVDQCSHSLQCSTAFNGSYCYERKCTCPDTAPVPVDGTCGTDCQEGQSFSSITGSCLPNVTPGYECTYTSQCHSSFPGTLCVGGICKCGKNKVFTGTRCDYTCPSGYMKGAHDICVPGCTESQIEHNGECLPYASPGQDCKVNAQCLGDSLCGNGICTCRPNMQIVGGVCQVIKVFPDQSCALGEECVGGSYCVDGTCLCGPGTVNINNQCIKPVTVPPGGSCFESFYKCINGADCVAGTCICPPDTRLINGKCTKELFAFPGEDCGSGQECTRNSVCNHETLKCECINTSKIAIGRSCVDRLRSYPGYPCGNGEICINGSVCYKGVCKCPGNQIVSNKMCVEPRRLMPGNKCSEDDICTGNSECDRKTMMCQCRPHHITIGGICTRIVLSKPGEKCSGQQYRCILNSYCNGYTCVCLQGMKLIGGQCKTPLQKQPGSFCTEVDECTNMSTCIKGRCTCTSPRILKNFKCEIPVEVRAGESCNYHDICLGGSSCVNGRCLCGTNEYIRSGICTEKVSKKPGEHCNDYEICSGGSYCSRSKYCTCNPGYAIEDSKCVRKTRSNPGESCKSGERCLGNSTCLRDICTCPKSTTLSGKSCIPVRDANIGESCANGEICLSGSKCEPYSKICACPPGYVNRNAFCVPIEVNPGSSCSNGETCIGGSYCKNNICICPQDKQFIVNNICSPTPTSQTIPVEESELKNSTESYTTTKKNYLNLTKDIETNPISRVKRDAMISLGYECTNITLNNITTSPCIQNAFCLEGFCQCSYDFLQAGNACYPKNLIGNVIKEPGEDCETYYYCNGGSTCNPNTKKCECNTGTILYNSHCVKKNVVGEGSSCNETQQCGPGLECIDGICVDVTQPINATVVEVGPGQPCPKSDRYIVCKCTGNSILANNYCICPGGEKIIDGVCVGVDSVADPGESCVPNFTICLGNSNCLDNICTCNEGFINVNKQCVPSSSINTTTTMTTTPMIITPTPTITTTTISTTTTIYIPGIGEPCTSVIGCRNGAICLNRICQCPPNTILINGQCVIRYTTANPGEPCSSDGIICIGGSACINNICTCPQGSYIVDGKCVLGSLTTPPQPSWRIIDPGFPCGMPFTRCGGGSYCSGGLCMCPPNFVPIKNVCTEYINVITTTSQPFTPLFPGDVCGMLNSYCTGGSSCINGFCQCQNGQVPMGTICVDVIGQTSTMTPITTLLPGESCDAVCELLRTCQKYCGGGSICIGGVCTCGMGYVAINGICQINKDYSLGNDVKYVADEPSWITSYRYPGQDCNTFTVCTGGSACDGKICQCPTGFVPTRNDRSCINSNYLREISTKTNDIINNSRYTNLLVRTPELSSIIKPFKSMKYSSKYKKCYDDTQCEGGMICNTLGLCQCPKQLTNFNGQCIDIYTEKLAYPGSKCISKETGTIKLLTCANGSQCNKTIGYCSCPVGTLPNLSSFCVTADHVDSKLALPGKGCDKNITPNCANNAICQDDFCVCPYGTKNNGNGVCSSRVTLDEGIVLREFNKKLINDPCNNTMECIFPGECKKGICSCPPEMKVSDERTCLNKKKLSRIGEYCDEVAGIYCINNSACIKHYCTCKEHFIPIRINNELECKSSNYVLYDFLNHDNNF